MAVYDKYENLSLNQLQQLRKEFLYALANEPLDAWDRKRYENKVVELAIEINEVLKEIVAERERELEALGKPKVATPALSV